MPKKDADRCSSGSRGKAKSSKLLDTKVPINQLPFYIHRTEVPYKTGKTGRSFEYHMPSEWKFQSSQREIMNNHELVPEVKKLSLMINAFFLKKEHAFVGKRGVRVGYIKFFKEHREEIAAENLQLYALIVARHLLSLDIFAISDFAQVFDDMGSLMFTSLCVLVLGHSNTFSYKDYRDLVMKQNLIATAYSQYRLGWQERQKRIQLYKTAQALTTPYPRLSPLFFENGTSASALMPDASYLSLSEVFSPPHTVDDDIGLSLNQPVNGGKHSFHRYNPRNYQ